ncbi:YhzD family protein [Numidum massiliense]|uniref:YhzD family protein n=1 Tax=Numidum massiliense TaxID=1522315 RepID=UPI001E393792|nr:YhzD family protein [Numidum massiliense]
MTVYDQDGTTLYDQPIEANSDKEAKEKGMAWLAESDREQCPYRIFHTTGRLVAFHSHQAKRA